MARGLRLSEERADNRKFNVGDIFQDDEVVYMIIDVDYDRRWLTMICYWNSHSSSYWETNNWSFMACEDDRLICKG
jgi:hypothetical protein